MNGTKHDEGKPRWDLVPFAELEEIVKVITFGAEKYDDNNWQKVDPERYVAAMLRHISDFRQNESIDAESGLHHLAHAGACILFLLWHDGAGNSVPPIAHHITQTNYTRPEDRHKNRTQIAIDETWRKTVNDVRDRKGGSLVHMEDDLSMACCPFCNQLVCDKLCVGYDRQRYLTGDKS